MKFKTELRLSQKNRGELQKSVFEFEQKLSEVEAKFNDKDQELQKTVDEFNAYKEQNEHFKGELAEREKELSDLRSQH